MARFDIYRNPGASGRKSPYLLDLQAPLLHEFQTRVVIPLTRPDRLHYGKQYPELFPVFMIGGEPMLLQTASIGTVPASELRVRAGSIRSEQHTITSALDFLFNGY